MSNQFWTAIGMAVATVFAEKAVNILADYMAPTPPPAPPTVHLTLNLPNVQTLGIDNVPLRVIVGEGSLLVSVEEQRLEYDANDSEAEEAGDGAPPPSPASSASESLASSSKRCSSIETSRLPSPAITHSGTLSIPSVCIFGRFRVRCTVGGAGGGVDRGIRKQGGTFKYNSTAEIIPNQLRSSACKMVRTLLQLMRTLDRMPEERTILMKLLCYNNVTSADYEPPFFRCCTEEACNPWTKNPLTMEVGNVNSKHIILAFKLKSVLDHCEDENDDTQDDEVSLGADFMQRDDSSESDSEVNQSQEDQYIVLLLVRFVDLCTVYAL
ncbi:hypothetical protein M0R45_013970 [Rubus argutus]|uniref:HORMA domain-containing protein n=1 Tax=Rubus argutus TaxID=59490 RepID=A0AAW1XLF0_RUBAR